MIKKYNCHIVLVVLLIIISQLSLFSQSRKSSGKYKITISLPTAYQGVRIKEGQKFELIKEKWGDIKGTTINTSTSKNQKVIFEGDIFPFSSSSSSFTAGCYQVRMGSTILFKIFYSSLDGQNFTETINTIPTDSPYIQDFERQRVKKDKYGTENELYLKAQNFQKLLALLTTRDTKVGSAAEEHIKKIGGDSLTHIGNQLKLRASKECDGKLFKIYIDNTPLPNYHPQDTPTLEEIGDARLIFTKFGEDLVDKRLNQICQMPVKEAIKEIDILLNNKYLTDSIYKALIVKKSYRFFKETNIMGREGVAIHIAQKYIKDNPAFADDPISYDATYFSELNMRSLVGMQAPSFALKDTSGILRTIDELLGYYTIVYFYSEDCANCAKETQKLVSFIDNYSQTPLGLYTVNIKSNNSSEKSWHEYLDKFSTINPFVTRIDVSTLSNDSTYYSPLLNYGIVSFPTLYLIAPNGKIIGRKIKTENVKEILTNEMASKKKIHQYFNQIFSTTSDEFINSVIDTLATRSKGDFYYELLSELYKFLSQSDNYSNQLGAQYLGEKYICPQKDSWDDKIFSNWVCNEIKKFDLNRLGTIATDIHLYDIASNPQNLLSKKNKKKIIFFFRPNCGICTEVTSTLKKIYKQYRKEVEIKGIYVGQNLEELKKYLSKERIEWELLYDKEGKGGLKEKYDLENIPQIYILDKDNTVIAKDIEAKDIEAIISK